MRVIAISRLREFWETNPAARKPLADWLKEVSAAQWRVPQDIKNRYATASFLPGRRVVFNIKGNDFRLVVAVAYVQQALFIKFVGTHAEYDRINATTVEPPP
jgi:mRNA interferase HigB